jgi:hypothetical protein
MAAETKISVLEDEKALYEPLFINAKKALVFLSSRKKNFKTEIEAGALFLRVTHQALVAAAYASEVAPANVEVLGPPRRLADTPSGLKDLVELRVKAPEGVSVLLAEADFNGGGNQKTFFRRLAQSDRWIARVYWPLSANSVKFKVQAPGATQPVEVPGEALAGRPAMSTSFELAEKSMKVVIKKYKETSFRAEGADSIKTNPIP